MLKKSKTLKAQVNIQLSNNKVIEYKITCSLDGVININLNDFTYINYEDEEDFIMINYGEELENTIFINYNEEEEDYI